VPEVDHNRFARCPEVDVIDIGTDEVVACPETTLKSLITPLVKAGQSPTAKRFQYISIIRNEICLDLGMISNDVKEEILGIIEKGRVQTSEEPEVGIALGGS